MRQYTNGSTSEQVTLTTTIRTAIIAACEGHIIVCNVRNIEMMQFYVEICLKREVFKMKLL